MTISPIFTEGLRWQMTIQDLCCILWIFVNSCEFPVLFIFCIQKSAPNLPRAFGDERIQKICREFTKKKIHESKKCAENSQEFTKPHRRLHNFTKKFSEIHKNSQNFTGLKTLVLYFSHMFKSSRTFTKLTQIHRAKDPCIGGWSLCHVPYSTRAGACEAD